jgi:adenosylhomocysteine nucleosidase
MAIGIISAMQEEMQTLLDHLDNKISTVKGMRTYYSGKLFTKDVVLVFSRWGKVASATTATQLINDHPVDEIIFTGVAGAINDKLEIGDIVIGNKLFQHDVDARPLYKKYEIPLLSKSFFETSASRRDKLRRAAETFLMHYNRYIDTLKSESFDISQPKLFVGDIASGDQFITSMTSVSTLLKEIPEIYCVEMEGAAVAQVCYEYKIPCSILRIISDKANNNAHIDFPKFAKEIASHYALGILENYCLHADT